MKVTLGYLYPDVMSTYGDRGNIETILRRCGWRGIETEVRELRLGDPIRPGELDMIVIGSGGESQQRLIAADLAGIKGPGIRQAVADGTAALAVGGGYELFGRFCQPGDGAELRGAGVFDAWTIRRRAILGGHYGTITEARSDRVIGDLIVRWDGKLLVGFENHSGATYLGESAQPLGQVLRGHGNRGDGTEGVLLGSAVGTHLRGPCLPRNPELADFLICAALRRRYGSVELMPLPDSLELAAHDVAMRRAQQVRPGARGRLVPAVLRRSGPRPGPGMRPRRGPARPRIGPGRAARPDASAAGRPDGPGRAADR